MHILPIRISDIVTMSYRKSCKNIQLNPNTMVLAAQCSTPSGEWRWSHLDLAKSIKCTKASSVEGLALIDGSEDRFISLTDEAKAGNIEKVHIGNERWFRAWVKYQVRMSDNIFTGMFNNNWYWKWAQIDLDQHVRNNQGTLEFVMDKPKSWRDHDLVPSFVGDALTDERMENGARKIFFASRTSGRHG